MSGVEGFAERGKEGERRGKERKGKERKGKERKGRDSQCVGGVFRGLGMRWGVEGMTSCGSCR